ncbi:MAG: VOC family protein [Candidatus Korobacteraceae bacterium]
MRLHHTGIVVPDIKAYGEIYAATLGLAPTTEIFHDPLQKVRVQFWGGGESESWIELIEPAAEDSPVWRACRKGGGLDHLCYETPDIEKTVQHSLANGGALVRDLAPAVAFGGRRIAFLYFLELGLIEFVETPA